MANRIRNERLEIKLTEEQRAFIITEIDGIRFKLNMEKENEIIIKRDMGVVS